MGERSEPKSHGNVSFTADDIRAGRVHVISDTHFGDPNIVYLARRPGWRMDGEHDLLAHEQRIFEAWKRAVSPDEWVLHLGDVAWNSGGANRAIEADLPGIVEVIEGNHDSSGIRRKVRNGLGWRFVDPLSIEWTLHTPERGKRPAASITRLVLITHYPIADLPEGAVNLHGHDHGTTVTFAREEGQPQYVYDHRYRSISAERMSYSPELLAGALDLLLMQSINPGLGNRDPFEALTTARALEQRL